LDQAAGLATSHPDSLAAKGATDQRNRAVLSWSVGRAGDVGGRLVVGRAEVRESAWPRRG
jgi:hypothetical protein